MATLPKPENIIKPDVTGLVRAWPMIEGGGVTTIEALIGRYAKFINVPTWQNSPYGHSIKFISSSSQRLDCDIVTEVISAKRLTVLAWVRRTSSSDIFILGNCPPSFTSGWYLLATGSGKLEVNIADGSYHLNRALFSGTEWSRIGFVFNGSLTGDVNRCRLYVNGFDAGTYSYISGIPNTIDSYSNDFTIGYAAGLYSNGQVADVQVYDKAFTTDEMLTDFQDPFRVYREYLDEGWFMFVDSAIRNLKGSIGYKLDGALQ